jgi:predicted small lipoprotein YifL
VCLAIVFALTGCGGPSVVPDSNNGGENVIVDNRNEGTVTNQE